MKLVDNFGRFINYLRVSITDRCNLRCQYCMPPEGIKYKSHNDILRYEEILKIVDAGAGLGITKVRITGGEPLVRAGVVDFVKRLSLIKGLEDISMTTNGVLLPDYAEDLKKAGLDRVNISLDTLKSEKYKFITRRNEYEQAINGIHSAIKTGLDPVKINVVVMKGINDNEIKDFVNLTLKYPVHVRFIEFMPMGQSKDFQKNRYISLTEIREKLNLEYNLIPTSIKSNGPAKYFKLKSGLGTIGFITPISHSFCTGCNRIRLTADGKLRPCLESDLEIDIKDKDGRIGNHNEIINKFLKALQLKPGSHHFLDNKTGNVIKSMFQIGG